MDPLQDNSAQITPDTHWQAEYEFYYKIINDEVDRLRFNEGFEPLEVDLYPTNKTQKGDPGPDFAGTTQIGRHKFRAKGRFTRDKNGAKILRVTIHAEPKK